MLFLSFLHLPLKSIDHFVELADALVAKADVMATGNGKATEMIAARWKLENGAKQPLSAMPTQTTVSGPVIY
jgi:hypothetical protein